MKKIIFKGFILAFTCVCVIGLQKKVQSDLSTFSNAMLENVEALTQTVELPEFVVLCDSKGWGRCYVEMGLAMNGEYMYIPCKFTGSMQDYCIEPRYHG